MSTRTLLLLISAVGLLPGLFIVLNSFYSLFEKTPDNFIGGTRLQTALIINNLPIRTALVPLLCLFLGMVLYFGSLFWMTKPIH